MFLCTCPAEMPAKPVISASGNQLGERTSRTRLQDLLPGTLVQTRVFDKWMSKQYWDCSENEWVELDIGTVVMIVDVNEMNIKFLAKDRVFSIHNCYNDSKTGVPLWCTRL